MDKVIALTQYLSSLHTIHALEDNQASALCGLINVLDEYDRKPYIFPTRKGRETKTVKIGYSRGSSVCETAESIAL